MFVFFKQKTAYEMRISDWSSDVCSSDLGDVEIAAGHGILPQAGFQLPMLNLDADLQALVEQVDAGRRIGFGDVPVGQLQGDRKRAVSGKRVSVPVDPGVARLLKKTTLQTN